MSFSAPPIPPSVIVLPLCDAGELHQPMLEATLQWRIAVDRNRDSNPVPGLAVNMVTAVDSQQRPTVPLEQPAELPAR
jgi:hypothetical protein